MIKISAIISCTMQFPIMLLTFFSKCSTTIFINNIITLVLLKKNKIKRFDWEITIYKFV